MHSGTSAASNPGYETGSGAGLIAVRSLSVLRGGRQVLHDLTLEIRPAALTVLIGPNGCGKSTLLKTIARLLPPSSGGVSIGGRPLDRLGGREAARAMALLPQSPVLPEGLRVRDLIALGRHPWRGLLRSWSPEDDAAIARAMAETGVTTLADRPVEALSGGQRQRCWIAMVLAQETGILMLDEPTTWLDLSVQMEIMAILARRAKAGATVLVVLHELNLAAAFADRMVMMKDGRILADGPPDAVMTAETLAAIFGLSADILQDPLTGRPVCLPRGTRV
ncbi:ABC transporter ATP-binding protein [Pseudogemmobacter bohemicus]|uniref:ABC transporter ATP-binding protein n=1 Tax=Pseudogemmobacter bohemicus TaxID=2250708 RepID=UPI000DD2DD9A|nr:ABC transporter ATP-binding protein [Pseudogemmobacter bohemicus]